MSEKIRPIIHDEQGTFGLHPDALVFPNPQAIEIPEEPEPELQPVAELDPQLAGQLDFTLSLYDEVIPEERLARFREFTHRYVASRYLRGNELDTPELQTAREQKSKFHGQGNHFFMVTCIDGRNIPTIMFTFIPHSEGGFIRTQAGDLNAFWQQYNADEVRLDKESDYYKRLEEVLTKYPDETIYYGLDSHVECAARGSMADAGGSTAGDGGLYEDIVRKKKIAAELQRVAQELKDSGKNVATLIPDLFSYDPHQGTMIMGLKRYLDTVDPETGFSPEVRAQLAREGKIIDTRDLLNDPAVITELEEHAQYHADFRTRYAESAARNWQALTDLYNEGQGPVYKMLVDKLHAIYDEDGTSDEIIDHKAKLLMKNLVTRWSIGRNDAEWEFDTHQERVIAITERAYGPFEGNIDHFLVTSFEGEDEVLENLQTANGLIRKFRKEGTIREKPSDVLLIDNQSVIKQLIPGSSHDDMEAEWQKLQTVSLEIFSHINWDDEHVVQYQPDDLRSLWYDAITSAQQDQGYSINAVAANNTFNALWEVFARMRSILGHSAFGDHLKQGRTVVLNSIMDQNGRPRIIVPFIPHTNGHHATLVQS